MAFDNFAVSAPIPPGCVLMELTEFSPEDRDATYYGAIVGYIGGKFKASIDEKVFQALAGREGEPIVGHVSVRPWHDKKTGDTWRAMLSIGAPPAPGGERPRSKLV